MHCWVSPFNHKVQIIEQQSIVKKPFVVQIKKQVILSIKIVLA